MHPVEFHVKGEKKDLHWTPVKSASDQPSSSIEYKSFNKDIEKVRPEVKEKKQLTNKKTERNKPRRISTPGYPLHLGGGAVGEGEKVLAALGLRLHWGKWKGWPHDCWSCCNSNEKTCKAPHPSLKVKYVDPSKKTEKTVTDVPLPAEPLSESIQDIRRDDYFGKGSFEKQVVKSNILNGKGVLNFQDGMYDGDILNNVPHGKGKFTYYSTKTEYEGEVVQGTIIIISIISIINIIIIFIIIIIIISIITIRILRGKRSFEIWFQW